MQPTTKYQITSILDPEVPAKLFSELTEGAYRQLKKTYGSGIRAELIDEVSRIEVQLICTLDAKDMLKSILRWPLYQELRKTYGDVADAALWELGKEWALLEKWNQKLREFKAIVDKEEFKNIISEVEARNNVGEPTKSVANVETTFRAIFATTVDATARTNLEMKPGDVARQGDVYVIMVENREDLYEIHKGLPRSSIGEKTEDRQIAFGSSNGARHIALGPVTIYSPSNDASPLEGPYIEASGKWELTHPEHADHVFPAGKFCITFQTDLSGNKTGRIKD